MLLKDRERYYKNTLIDYSNINSLRNKIIDMRIILQDLQLNYFVLSETKLDKSFPTSQFHLKRYKIRSRKDRNKYGGGLLQYVKKSLLCHRLIEYELQSVECICSELIIARQKWICFSIYRPPEYSNLSTFFIEIANTLSKALLKYQNIILMGGIDIDSKCKDIGTDKLEELCDAFNLKNLVKSETCFTKDNKSLIDLILTNKPFKELK